MNNRVPVLCLALFIALFVLSFGGVSASKVVKHCEKQRGAVFQSQKAVVHNKELLENVDTEIKKGSNANLEQKRRQIRKNLRKAEALLRKTQNDLKKCVCTRSTLTFKKARLLVRKLAKAYRKCKSNRKSVKLALRKAKFLRKRAAVALRRCDVCRTTKFTKALLIARLSAEKKKLVEATFALSKDNKNKKLLESQAEAQNEIKVVQKRLDGVRQTYRKCKCRSIKTKIWKNTIKIRRDKRRLRRTRKTLKKAIKQYKKSHKKSQKKVHKKSPTKHTIKDTKLQAKKIKDDLTKAQKEHKTLSKKLLKCRRDLTRKPSAKPSTKPSTRKPSVKPTKKPTVRPTTTSAPTTTTSGPTTSPMPTMG
ncbi:ftsH [Acrasis kona]|uniref:FtsH n=1 Tax=Acrasis kona TaxID=1008807 RepID=A0AAW2ZD59_9EUKA